jgi:transposase InsO family protein
MQLEPQMMQFLCSLSTDLENAKRGEKGRIVQQACGVIGRSEQWVYDQLKALGLMDDRKSRNDRGQSKVSKGECITVSNLMMQSHRDNGKQLMSLKEALSIAVANGLVSSDISSSTVSREMKRHRVHPSQLKQGTPFTQVRSLHPNHVWQFDVSVCVLYYLRKKEGLQVMPRDEFYKNKPENLERVKNDRVLRYLVTDHNTGTFYVEYFNTPGENAETLVEFLLNAFGKRDLDPFHGVPFMLVWDAGTANQSHLVKGMLDRLDVKHHAHEVGSPRAKGQVERTHDLVECEFESRLSMCQIDTLEELNAEAKRWSLMFNSTRNHRRHGHTRFGLWQTIKADQLRIRPEREFCKSLLQKIQPATRKVRGDLTIDFAIKGIGSNSYSVECIPDVCIGEQVQVTYNPYTVPEITVIHENLDGEKIHYTASPIERDAAGFDITAPVFGQSYKPVRETPVDTARKEMNRDAYGVDLDRDVKEAQKQRKPVFEGKIDPFADVKQADVPDFMDRKGQTLKVKTPKRLSDVRLTFPKAVPMIRNSIGIEPGTDTAKRLTRIFKQRFPDGIPEEILLEFTQEMNVLLNGTNELKRVENGE